MTREEQLLLEAKKLKDYVKYCISEGTIYSKKTRKRYESKDVHGYIFFHALGRKWKVHRVVWFMEHGTWPQVIDHIDGNKSNNHYSNLREATYKQNSYNCSPKSHSSKYKGVWKSKSGKYRASLYSDYKRIHLGYFNTQEEAALAYNNALEKADPLARKNKLEKSDEVKKLEAQLAVAKAAMEKFNKEFINVYHPGENWFPMTLVIPEALAEIERLEKN